MGFLNKVSVAWERRAHLRAMLENSRATYSQYGEDLVFDRLLKPRKSGTYVDVGAHHPVNGSNTYRLYCRGWRGLAIDPNPAFAADFAKHRPHDTFLNEGAAKTESSLTYFKFANDVLNTFDPTTVMKLRGYGFDVVEQQSISCRPLSDSVGEHLGVRQIDFLSVDCEGLDLDVLESLNFAKHRPTVILIEDMTGYLQFQQGSLQSEISAFLRGHRYSQIAQTAWSSIYMADDWERLFERSSAYDERELRGGYLPGQETVDGLLGKCA